VGLVSKATPIAQARPPRPRRIGWSRHRGVAPVFLAQWASGQPTSNTKPIEINGNSERICFPEVVVERAVSRHTKRHIEIARKTFCEKEV
jgi:hypothetical protein